MSSNDKKTVRYIIRGEIVTDADATLPVVMGIIEEIAGKARDHGTADVSVSVPRLTKVKL